MVSHLNNMSTASTVALTPMDSGYWWVSSASSAVKLQSPAVKRMKNGSSFLGYTDTSWNAGSSSRSAHSDTGI